MGGESDTIWYLQHLPAGPGCAYWYYFLLSWRERVDWMTSLPTLFLSEKGIAGGRHLSPPWPSRPAPTSNAPFTKVSIKALETRSAQFHANNHAHLNCSHCVCSRPARCTPIGALPPERNKGTHEVVSPQNEHQPGQREERRPVQEGARCSTLAVRFALQTGQTSSVSLWDYQYHNIWS